MKEEDLALLNHKVLSFMCYLLERNLTFNISNEKMTHGLLKVLVNMYEKPSAINKMHMIHRLFNLKMVESSCMTDHHQPIQHDILIIYINWNLLQWQAKDSYPFVIPQEI